MAHTSLLYYDLGNFFQKELVKNTYRNNVTVHDTFDWRKPVHKFLLKLAEYGVNIFKT